MNVLALICARGGSKAIPGKNLRPLHGKPLIVRAIEQARKCKGVSRVIVSTDSEEIASSARAASAEVPFMRPAELAGDTSPEWLVWRHALHFVEESGERYPDALLVVPATAPLRSVEDLDRCVERFAKGDCDIVITVTDAHRNPYFNMVRATDDGLATILIQPQAEVIRRQDAPPIYDMTTVGYVSRPQFVMERDRMFDGRVGYVVIPPERALDIDTPLDFKIAECLLET